MGTTRKGAIDCVLEDNWRERPKNLEVIELRKVLRGL